MALNPNVPRHIDELWRRGETNVSAGDTRYRAQVCQGPSELEICVDGVSSDSTPLEPGKIQLAELARGIKGGLTQDSMRAILAKRASEPEASVWDETRDGAMMKVAAPFCGLGGFAISWLLGFATYPGELGFAERAYAGLRFAVFTLLVLVFVLGVAAATGVGFIVGGVLFAVFLLGDYYIWAADLCAINLWWLTDLYMYGGVAAGFILGLLLLLNWAIVHAKQAAR